MRHFPIWTTADHRHAEAANTAIWIIEARGKLPFDAWARSVDAVVPSGTVTQGNGTPVFVNPFVDVEQGPFKDTVNLTWPEPVSGEVQLTLRIDE